MQKTVPFASKFGFPDAHGRKDLPLPLFSATCHRLSCG
uniref:Uncharacterized protein n=1 Tax=Arundo donax TaxID=35708 RepID=A0A0A9BZE6_ARUDO